MAKEKTLPTTNRNQAYHQLQQELTLPQSRQRILFAIQALGGKATAQQIKNHLKIEINQITGRITELREANKIQAIGTLKNPTTGKPNTIYQTIF